MENVSQRQSTVVALRGNARDAALLFDHVIPINDLDDAEVLRDLLPNDLLSDNGQTLHPSYDYVLKTSAEADAELPLYFEYPKRNAGFYSRGYFWKQSEHAIDALVSEFKLNQVPWLLGGSAQPTEPPEEKPADPMLSLIGLRVIDAAATPWATILEFRKDPAARRKLRRLRHFFEQSYHGKSKAYIEDDIAIRLEDYENTLKDWAFDTKTGILSIVLNSVTLQTGIASSIGLALFGAALPVVTAPLLASGMIELGKVSVEIAKRRHGRKKFRRDNPFDYVVEVSALGQREADDDTIFGVPS
jgi:hypothetical protein